jgi:hypothetical protein
MIVWIPPQTNPDGDLSVVVQIVWLSDKSRRNVRGELGG